MPAKVLSSVSHLLTVTEETIKELEPQGVTDVFNISVKDNSGGSRNTNTFLITFSTSTVPQHLTVGYLILDELHGIGMRNVKKFSTISRNFALLAC